MTLESNNQAKIAVIGECMVELSQQPNGQFSMGYGGDTLNTAVYLSRCGEKADYFTVLGEDTYSQSMLQQWQQEGVGTDQVKICQGQMPGLYIINNDENGERYFNYWRDTAAAKTLIRNYPEIFKQLTSYRFIFLSGITLSLYAKEDLAQLFSFLSHYRASGGIVVFDNNYRERNWGTLQRALPVFAKMMQHTDIALLSFDDEKEMYGEHTPEECIQRWVNSSVTEVVLKNGQHGCHHYINGETSLIPLLKVMKPVDTTAAGDSFNGGYLAAKLANKTSNQCIAAGQNCASTVIMHKGAIIDRAIDLTGVNSLELGVNHLEPETYGHVTGAQKI
ncbi:sugar kinase [Paraglaciecola sp.]|uniref:sugar kinase n=1 Tax=Paraglaciecola sp. TaxID=1920173 RepID=UPI003EF537A8